MTIELSSKLVEATIRWRLRIGVGSIDKNEADMTLHAGECVWIPCQVVRGPFADEKRVRLESPTGSWAGVVDVSLLRDEIVEGHTALRATIVEIGERVISARLPGQTRHSGFLTGPPAWFQALTFG